MQAFNILQLRTVSHVNGDTPDGYILGLSGRPFFIDVTIAHPTGATHMRNASTRHNHFALNSLKANKIAKFEHRCKEFHSDFVPLALETYCGNRKKLRNYLKEYLPKQPNSIIFHTLSCLTIGRKESLLFFKLEMFPSFQRPTVAYSTLERRLYNVIMI